MFRYETHLHTAEGSGCASASGAEQARRYKALGYDGIIVTDHFFNGNCAVTNFDSSIVFEKNKCRVSELISHSINELTTRAKNENKEIQIEGDDEQQLICDMEWTGEAIGNIVKNALDHTQAGGIVRITWDSTPAMFRIFISDNGNGIVPEDIYHIFKRFYRSKHSLDTQGIGLGLPLAKSIIEGQGGMILVQSEVGNGTTFTLSFLTEL